MPSKKISELPLLTKPKKEDFFPIDSSGVTKRLLLSDFTDYISSKISLTGGTLDTTTGIATFTKANGGSFTVGGFLTKSGQKHWENNSLITLTATNSITISGNYVLENSELKLSKSEKIVTIGDIDFNKCSQVFIEGSLLLIDSKIVNNGILQVDGAVILMGNSAIIGSGTLI